MLTVRANNKAYSVTFRETASHERLDKRGFEPITMTTATIWENDPANGPVPKANGYAHKSAKDVDNPELARELAFGRALKRLTESKFVRGQFWEAFRAAVRPERLTPAEANELAMLQTYALCPASCPTCDSTRARIAELTAKETI